MCGTAKKEKKPCHNVYLPYIQKNALISIKSGGHFVILMTTNYVEWLSL